MSTLVLGRLCPSLESIIGVEHDKQYVRQVREFAAAHGVSAATVVHAPLVPHPSGVRWYDLDTAQLGGSICCSWTAHPMVTVQGTGDPPKVKSSRGCALDRSWPWTTSITTTRGTSSMAYWRVADSSQSGSGPIPRSFNASSHDDHGGRVWWARTGSGADAWEGRR